VAPGRALFPTKAVYKSSDKESSMVDPARLLTISEASKLSPYSEPTIRIHIAAGRLPVVRIGRRLFVETEVLDKFLAGPKRQYVKNEQRT
jgi:excisionase family DNA binding protein